MAQGGETITYTFSESKETEDISNIGEIVIQSMDGAQGGNKNDSNENGLGGYIETATADVSNYNTLEIWVGGSATGTLREIGGFGKSNGGDGVGGYSDDSGGGGGSTELWADSESAFIAAADGGGGDAVDGRAPPFGDPILCSGGGGARGGLGGESVDRSGNDAEGTGFGGDGGDYLNGTAFGGKNGGQELGIASGGTLTTGGSSAGDGEIIIEYVQLELAPSINEASASPTGVLDENQTVTLSIDVSDLNDDTFDVVFRDASDNSQIGSTQSISSSGTATVEWSGREYGVDHSWFVEATDSTGTTTSSEFTFSITPPNANIPEFAGLGKRKGQRFSNVTPDKSDGVNAMKVFRATGNGNSFPQDFTEIDEISGSSISEFKDDNPPVGNVEYAFAPKLSDGSLGGESVVSTFTPDEDGAFISSE